MSVMHTSAVIANGASESNVIDLTDQVIVAILMPADWTAAVMTLVASDSRTGTFYKVHDEGGEVSWSVTDDMVFTLLPEVTRGLRYVKLRSGTAAVPVNQGAARTILVATVPDDRA